MRPVQRLAIVYDDACGLCTRAKDWMRRQHALVPLEFMPAGSPETQKRFPRLPPGELAVVANTGDAWLGNHAWIVCLWALRDYRGLSVRLTSPLLLLMAREAFAVLSARRSSLSKLLGLRNDRELEQELRRVTLPKCHRE